MVRATAAHGRTACALSAAALTCEEGDQRAGKEVPPPSQPLKPGGRLAVHRLDGLEVGTRVYLLV